MSSDHDEAGGRRERRVREPILKTEPSFQNRDPDEVEAIPDVVQSEGLHPDDHESQQERRHLRE